MKEIDVFNNRFIILKKIEKKLYIKFLIFLVMFFLIILILFQIEYPNVYKFEGFTSGDKIVLPVIKKDLEKLKGNVLKIEDKIYKYDIFSYDYLDKNNNYSNEFLVTLTLDKKIKSNQVVSILIEDGKTNLYKSFIKKIWRGF